MTTTHTPGPWAIEYVEREGNFDTDKYFEVAGPGHDYVAHVWTAEDARLIAAAPTMLETMEYVLPWLTELSRQWEHTVSHKRSSTNGAQVVINNLKNAIAKARVEG